MRITQIGGANDRETTVLPEARFRIGGFDAVLRPAHVFSRPVGNDRHYGLLGTDVVSQAALVTIDFHSMTLTLR